MQGPREDVMGPEWGEWQWRWKDRFKILRKFSPQDLVSGRNRGGEG